jgi:hypothetical protein
MSAPTGTISDADRAAIVTHREEAVRMIRRRQSGLDFAYSSEILDAALDAFEGLGLRVVTVRSKGTYRRTLSLGVDVGGASALVSESPVPGDELPAVGPDRLRPGSHRHTRTEPGLWEGAA